MVVRAISFVLLCHCHNSTKEIGLSSDSEQFLQANPTCIIADYHVAVQQALQTSLLLPDIYADCYGYARSMCLFY